MLEAFVDAVMEDVVDNGVWVPLVDEDSIVLSCTWGLCCICGEAV